jgi:DNA repair exonuclease SbcCD ATPase subunit
MEKDLVNEETVEQEVEKKESSIDLDKLDEINQPEEELSETEILKKQLAEANKRAEELERQRQKDKEARDKAMKERAELSREVKKKEEALQEPNEELEMLRATLAEKELAEKKTNLLLASTDRLAINQDMASKLVDAVYHPDTGEVDVDTLVDSFTTIIKDVREAEFEKGYNLRDNEMASQKPRSIGEQQTKDATDVAIEDFLKRRNKI